MSKHRRKTRHRQITIAAVVLSALAIPTAAMACKNDQSAGDPGSSGQRQGSKNWQNWQNASLQERWKGGGWTRHTQKPTSQATTAPATPAAPASTEPAAPEAPTSTEPATPEAPTSTEPATPASTEPAAPEATASPSTTATAAPASAAVASVLALVNSERGKVGCSALTLNEKLSKAAQDHSADMAAHQNMSHTGSDGSDPGQRITAAGYSWSAYGENVAYGYSTPEQVMAGWMSSPGHKRNILDCGFKEIGVGLAQPGSYWTQDFGTAR
ncbi:CAP domain-containing protein [Streptomyces sp. NBC_01340]|uniref:CAP domain-containing protein n=2 Tax=Streptomyces TaxID=1883 RepID=UPI002252EF8D|nr:MULTISPECIES: CAP domain-containing protein [unclassified Streptomyces]MCX4452054.1 CAP domain-containing protein [Streptomyces sp. NBC_01719]MCX4491414.1 CAP domain-containing protein [Streptomyces sp. NBC_01728]MCX4594010.1 CAP domain-containing protein [Streptomyces sp. NBC_01549]WSI36725.1 CAP domain-containing protein [Streptomyces sp. NBC_01340]